MNRRQFAQCALATLSMGFALPASAQSATTSEKPDFGGLTEDEMLETVFEEIEALGPGAIDALKANRIVRPDRSILLTTSLAPSFENPPLTPELIARFRGRKYWQLDLAERPVPAWPANNRAPDYIHLEDYPAPDPNFRVHSDLLAFLASRNDFDLTEADDIIVFGLRGCSIVSDVDHEGWAAEHALRIETPAHLVPRCVIGLWRRSDGQVAVFRGSTVPAAHNIFSSLIAQGAGTSLLPTGLYHYVRGSHRASYPTRIQRGALIMQGKYPVLRTARDLAYDPFTETTAWTLGSVHNVHAAGLSNIFDSAGCQVIHGRYLGSERLKAEGAWAAFRSLAGTVGDDGLVPSDGQSRFSYMLLTGLEAALASTGSTYFAAAYRPLRMGSQGERVKKLQHALIDQQGRDFISRPDGDFGPRTSFAVLARQKDLRGDYASTVADIVVTE